MHVSRLYLALVIHNYNHIIIQVNIVFLILGVRAITKGRRSKATATGEEISKFNIAK